MAEIQNYTHDTISQVVLNNTTYDIADAISRSVTVNLNNRVTELENTAVFKNKDNTITGTITNTGHNKAHTIKETNTDFAQGNNGISSNSNTTISYYPGYQIIDNNGRIGAKFENVIKSDGTNGWNLYARSYDTAGVAKAQKGLSCSINKQGQATWVVHDPANFRTAIGADVLATSQINGLMSATDKNNLDVLSTHSTPVNLDNAAGDNAAWIGTTSQNKLLFPLFQYPTPTTPLSDAEQLARQNNALYQGAIVPISGQSLMQQVGPVVVFKIALKFQRNCTLPKKTAIRWRVIQNDYSSYRPRFSNIVPIFCSTEIAGDPSFFMEVQRSGEVRIYNNSSNSVTIPVGTPMYASVTYLSENQTGRLK